MPINWLYLIPRLAILFILLFLLYLSQRFWLLGAWRLAGRIRLDWLRRLLRGAIYAVLAMVCIAVLGGILGMRHRFALRASSLAILAGLWLLSSFLAYLAIELVAGAEWLWSAAARRANAADPLNPSRRYFFQTASYLAGAVPFVGALYGFAAERLRYRVERVDVPLQNLPAALDGLRIAQLSDIHIGGYMPREQVRRAVDMANEFGAELAVVTGDFITGATDPLEECVAELARLRAPLGVWGCNGNHEIYAGAEDAAAELFLRAGMRLLRQQSAELNWRGQLINLIGVDYQRERTAAGRRLPKLVGVERLVRRDALNLLLSHNPNAFPRAAELGIELTLAGHTHGGQVQVEILDRRWNPARFITPFTAGLYRRPLGLLSVPVSAPSEPGASLPPPDLRLPASGLQPPASSSPAQQSRPDSHLPASNLQPLPSSFLYVNRGLGTIAAPVRIGVPPEITLLTLRRA